MEQEIPISKSLMKAVSEETRTAILRSLERRPMTASEVSRVLGKHVTTIAEHMAILESSELVERNRRPGRKWVYYSLTKRADELLHPKNYYKYVVILTAAIVLMSGTLFASSKAMPGDILYQVKRSMEGVRVAAAGSETDRAMVHLQLAEERLKEAKHVAERNDTAAVTQATNEYMQDLEHAKLEIEGARRKGWKVRPAVEALDESTSKHITALENIARRGHGASEEISAALNYTRGLHQEMDEELGESGWD